MQSKTTTMTMAAPRRARIFAACHNSPYSRLVVQNETRPLTDLIVLLCELGFFDEPCPRSAVDIPIVDYDAYVAHFLCDGLTRPYGTHTHGRILEAVGNVGALSVRIMQSHQGLISVTLSVGLDGAHAPMHPAPLVNMSFPARAGIEASRFETFKAILEAYMSKSSKEMLAVLTALPKGTPTFEI